ncbi:glycerophosphodiester phosphodiesterase family protein [Agarilytica rhodophyticola]|uniref:glycerophosphodiester phosphodiesterase family protein n=1 Tax=Agarilytica rhodophyticola TaxID=1737490 RepID=UPI000B3478DD|nr:glycerophosphodiester phosphodiesterase family protein [Agarilytica rhodophyticola]
MKKSSYTVVGHRGFPQQYPENSLIGLVAAAEAGAHAVELDVQISQDNIAMVFHDDTLDRVSGEKGYIWDYTAEQLHTISCHEPQRFNQQYHSTPISTLEEVSKALANYSVKVFVEIKEQSMHRLGREDFLDRVIDAIAAIKQQATIISFDFEILHLAQQRGFPIGWVLTKMDNESLQKAQNLQPEVLAYDVKKLNSKSELWRGPWQWFLYDIVKPDTAQYWFDKGVEYIETWDVQALL